MNRIMSRRQALLRLMAYGAPLVIGTPAALLSASNAAAQAYKPSPQAPLTPEQSAAAQRLSREVERIIQDVYQGLSGLPTPMRTRPGVSVRLEPFIIGLMPVTDDGQQREIVLPMWSQAPQGLQQVFERWVTLAGTGQSAADYFADTFNWALVLHELGHHLMFDHLREAQLANHAKQEEMANRFMVAWWASQPQARARLDRVGATWEALWNKLENPVPTGVDPIEHLQRNYWRIANNPDAYGWYQYRWMAMAWQERDRLSLAETVRDLTTPANKA